ncbi:uncharacterized protein LOC116296484 [Actinia tenebrosa]|uniref:Uncharacterized protein LOC116296484 n=1 Tax=Actinia tenebrosa TaxID=6105 RepID=A0A6P8I5V4_ACTTE|nr:uncharacterized protein LOC116296484 [Actinia tenebrosa]
MAELAVVKVSLKLVWALVANRAIKSLEHGDLADEKLRQLLLSEFRKIHEELNVLRRKELIAAVAFMENGYELLKNDSIEAKREFTKARDAAQVAFGVVKEVQDKILAAKIMVSSALHEFDDKPETAASLCLKYVSRLNNLPEILNSCQVLLGQKFGSILRTFSSSSNRQQCIGLVSEVNRCVWQFIQLQLPDLLQEKKWPSIAVGSHEIDPITDFLLLRRVSSDCIYLPSNVQSPVMMVTANNKLFLVEAQVATTADDDPLLVNSLKALDLEDGSITNLVGHSGVILTIAKFKDETRVVTGSMDKQIILWDTNTLKCCQILSEHCGSIRSVVLNDTHIFSGSTDSLVKVWSKDTYESVHTLEGHVGPISSLAVSNRHLFSCAVGDGIRYWDLKKWECLHSISLTENVFSMYIVTNSLIIHYHGTLQFIKLGNLKEHGKMSQVGNSSVLTGKAVCCSSGSELKSINVSLLKCTCSSNLSQSCQKEYTVNCMCYDDISARLFVACTDTSKRAGVIVTI